MIEHLESRQHLSNTLVGNILTIVGTDRGDDIAIAAGRREFVVHVNGAQQAFDTRKIRTIRIQGLRGDDSIIVSPKLAIRCSIEAGAGNDRVGGGAGNDTIFGGHGNDTLVGNAGFDYLDGGRDDDWIDDTFGVNMIHGGAGVDRSLTAGTFDSFLSGVEVPSTIAGPFLDAPDTGIHFDGERLILRYTFNQGAGGDWWEYDGPVQRMDGRDEVRFTYIPIGGGAIVIAQSFTVDITDSVLRGLIFVKETNDAQFGGDFELPLLLPAR